MKSKLAVAALAAATVVGALTAAGSASAQPWRYGYGPAYDYSGGWHDRAYGPRYGEWRRGYYARWHRYPVRVCRPGGCFWR